ncbi:MAG: TolC family protein [Cyclobacteriaceae bacterium]|nr:TolC family protein [Cytophagales bacterium]HNP76087.1 TolC family protein [Cyclobacteriaceae bacterium]
MRINSRSLPLTSVILISLLVFSFASQGQTIYSLPAAVTSAKSSSPILKAASYNINMAEGSLITARLHTNPVLNNQTLQMTSSKYFSKGTEFSNPLNRQVWWQLTKPFVLPAQRRNRIDIAQQNIGLNQQGYSENIRNFSSDVANQWLNAWVLKSRLEILNEAYSNIDSLVKINKSRLKNQVITQTDLIRTQLLQDQYQLQRINAEKDFRNELQRLRYLIGVTDSINVDINGVSEFIAIPDQMDTLIAQAIRERPDVRAARLAVLLAETNIKYQKSLVLPQPELGMIWNPQNTIPYLGFFGTVRVPLFDRNQGEIERSRFQRMQADEGVRNAQVRIETEVRAAYQTYQTEKENLRKYGLMLTQADLVLDNVRYAYLKGGTTIIDFLDAQRSWFDTQQLYLNARLSYFQSYIQVLYVTGIINQL